MQKSELIQRLAKRLIHVIITSIKFLYQDENSLTFVKMADLEIVEKKDFTVVTNAGKKVITNLTMALKNDNSAELISVMKTWIPELLNTVLDVVCTKAKVWDRIDSDPELAFLRDLDFKSLFIQRKSTLELASQQPPPGVNSDMFHLVHRSMVALEASQHTIIDKLNVALATDSKSQPNDWEKYKLKITTANHFVQKYGDKVRVSANVYMEKHLLLTFSDQSCDQ